MKKILVIILLLIGQLCLADEVKVEFSPTRPVVGEVFQAYFRIFTDFDEEPVITFTPVNIEVVGKSNQGISTRTVYANGKLTVTREMTVVYDLVAARTGLAYMRDIKVQLDQKVLRAQGVQANVLKEPEVQADVFVMADVPKKDLYLGEGIIVRYYLYNKYPVNNLDIKKYPKLNKFLKRFLQEAERTERVSVDGQIYMRTQIYAAKLYPEKLGDLKVDSLQLSVTYPNARMGDPFGAFGLNRDFKTKTIQSEVIKVNVRPLPVPVPEDFTGLVGKHDFNLQFNQNKLIVNEPLEVKFTVSGVGALENLEAPTIIKNPGLEEFETNGDLKISNADMATKVFDYTFLAKSNMKLPGKSLSYSYFDPESNKYISTTAAVPEIEIAGGKAGEKNETNSPSNKSPVPQVSKVSPPTALAPPVTSNSFDWKQYLPIFNFSLAAFAVFISIFWIVKQQRLPSLSFSKDIPRVFRKGSFELSDFVRWMTPVIKTTGKTPLTIIKEAPLSDESKRYFVDLLEANDYKDYSTTKKQMDYKFQSAYFRELSKYIESCKT